MLACATISKNEYECPGDSLRDLLDEANSDMQGKFEQAQLKYAEDIAAAKEQAAEMAEEVIMPSSDHCHSHNHNHDHHHHHYYNYCHSNHNRWRR